MTITGPAATEWDKIQAQLQAHGLDWHRLHRLARKALHDEKRARNITLDPDRDTLAAEYLADVAIAWLDRYQPELANGVSYPTSAYRRMRRRLPDFLRAEHGDERTGVPLHTVAVDRMPDRPHMDEDTFAQAVESVSAGLTSRALWTLRHLAAPMAADGATLAQVAASEGITFDYAAELVEELGWQLGRKPSPAGEDHVVELFALVAA